jgi:hypothetical protein
MAEAKKLTLPSRNYNGLEYVSPQGQAIIPNGIGRETVMTPEFWVNHSAKIKRNTIIHYWADDYSYGGQLLVTTADGKIIHFISIYEWDGPKDVKETASSIYKIIGAASGFKIVVRATGTVQREGIGSKAEANAILAELEKAAKG